MSVAPTIVSQHSCFGGKVTFYNHSSKACQTEMNFSVYHPPQVKTEAVPVLYFLSGLTCTEENFSVKAGAQQYAAEQGLMLVVPDTSPRNTGIPGEDEDWSLGTGAGFYVDATQEPWSQYYQMYTYVAEELPALIVEHFPARPDRQGIFGHSMGGHGALVCALRNPDRFRSVSAFAPIAAPSQSPWGQKAFTHYLGEDVETWKQYDATELIARVPFHRPILIDQGTADPFLEKGQLLPEQFEQACTHVGQPLTLRRQTGYDHGYYFISTFMEDHIRHHAATLCR
ncbi:MAG: S-formylglutathione hydrolase [Prochlorotrichaceae cyanobacterium]